MLVRKRKLKRENTQYIEIHKSNSETVHSFQRQIEKRQRESWRRCQKLLKNVTKTTVCRHTEITIFATQQLYNLQFQFISYNFEKFKISGINSSSFAGWLLEIFAKLQGNSSSSVNFSVTLHHFFEVTRAKLASAHSRRCLCGALQVKSQQHTLALSWVLSSSSRAKGASHFSLLLALKLSFLVFLKWRYQEPTLSSLSLGASFI